MRLSWYNRAVDHFALSRLVREALENLNNRSALAVHPLARMFSAEPRPLSGGALRRVLIDAIEQLKPLAGAAVSGPEARQYLVITRRCVEGRGRDEVARLLHVSPRQVSRDQQQGVETLTAYLALRCSPDATELAFPSPRATSAPASPEFQAASSTSEIPANGEVWATGLGETISGVLDTLARLVGHDRLAFTTLGIDTLPPIAIPLPVLRQTIMNLLMYATEVQPGQEVLVSGTDTAEGIMVRIQARREAIGPSVDRMAASPDAKELLAAGRQLLEAAGGKVLVGAEDSLEPLLTLVLPPSQLHTVLVVDDNVDLVGLFRRYVRGQPYRLIQATSASSTLRLAREVHPRALVLDVMLPAEDGWDVLAQLRADPETREIPVVVCSILPERGLALSLGVSEFLPKPVTRQALLDALERCCSSPAGHPVRP